ncbi:hypothetical protein WICMUC_000478 [Wickerhamomyces mucosus]|uniref:SAM domain-containing protein n=1 Tax=Wickerhamomyces mucosus TaxID=1378264 RepID=A0A9P8PXM7_9ASCO|nr:hypothetical protein WICMUC_000478 [Wickerhamomyces mucosus]
MSQFNKQPSIDMSALDDSIEKLTSLSQSQDTNNKSNNKKHTLLAPNARNNTRPEILVGQEPFQSNDMALLSPPGSRYAFESEIHHTVISPILSNNCNNDNYGNVFSNANTNLQRPLSAQDINHNLNNESYDAFRPFSAQGPNQVSNLNIETIERPLSSLEIDSATFKSDVANLINWTDKLNSNQLRALIDNLLLALPDDITNYTKSKLQSFTFHNSQDGSHKHSRPPFIASPIPMYQSAEQEPVNLDSVLNYDRQVPNSSQPWSPSINNLQRALSPNFTSFDRSSVLHDASFNRPRSADPYGSKLVNNKSHGKNRGPRFENNNENINNNNNNSNQNNGNLNGNSGNNDQVYDNRGTFDITNLAQQLTQTQISLNEYNNPNFLKLSALSTINNRAQLDSNKKRAQPLQSSKVPHHPNHQQQHQSQPQQQELQPQSQQHQNKSFNQVNYENQQIQQHNHHHHQQQQQQTRVNYYDSITSPVINRVKQTNHQLQQPNSKPEFFTPSKQINSQINTPKSPAIDPKQITNIKLLTNIPGWLKTLRLHKYTSVLQDVPWKELIYFTDDQLESKGVTAMGARGKLLKAFEIVKQYYEDGLIKDL